ncbi:MAG TPA: response regulator [Vicinamibacteria bacterium]|nr:response regulator [Vicinamibacteria bacterium]
MRVLIAEDDPISRRLLEVTLLRAGYEVALASDGREAWGLIDGPDPPRLAILDWMMPGLDGIEICHRLRHRPRSPYTYIVLVTTKNRGEDLVAGLEAGADDYLMKPYDPHELQCRVAAGARVVALEAKLERKIKELERAVRHVGQLQGLLPMCMYCKKIRDDSDTWHRLESYIQAHSSALFSHSLCDECRVEHFPKVASPG